MSKPISISKICFVLLKAFLFAFKIDNAFKVLVSKELEDELDVIRVE